MLALPVAAASAFCLMAGCVAGLKPGQRKVLFTCLKRNDKREVKVAQLAGSVAEMSAYHHGEVSAAVLSAPGAPTPTLCSPPPSVCSKRS